MLRVVPLVLMLLGLAFAGDVAGSLAGPLGLFLGMGFLGLGVLSGGGAGDGKFRWVLLVLGVASAACGVGLLALWPAGRVNRLLATAALLAGTDVTFRAFGRLRAELALSAAISLFAALFFLILQYSPPAWMLWQNASLALSKSVGESVGRPLLLGPSYSGLNVTALLVISVLTVFALTGRRRGYRLPLALVYLAAALFTYLLAMTFVRSYDEAAQLSEVAGLVGDAAAKPVLALLARHVPWNVPLLLVLAQLPAVWIVGGRSALRGEGVLPARAPRVLWTAAVTLGLLAGAAVLVVRTPERPALSARVVLYQKGYLNWNKPDFTSFGEHSSGMLGRLPVFLQELGFEVSLSPRLDNEALAGARVAVMFNPYEKLGDDEHAALWDFVRRGGSLLVVGEHTWLNDKHEDTLNQVMSPSDIRFNFDSATYQIGGWLHGYGFTADPVTWRMRDDMNQPGIGIGASLEVRGSAEPMLLGTHGWSDGGVREHRPELGFLGDNRYVPGEQLGDVVLAAAQDIGAGRVVAVGDTSGYFNLLMMGSHDIVERLFAKLASPPAGRHHVVRLVLALVFILAAAVVFAVHPRWSMVPVLVVALVAGSGVQVLASWEASPLRLVPRGDVAWVDGWHAGRYSREMWRPDGLAGLYLNLMRNDMQPLRMDARDAERLLASRMLFIIAPTCPFGRRDVDLIRRFIHQGGYVVVCAGADSSDALAPLLLSYGLRVRNKPLGPFITNFPAAGAMVRFHVGYVVENVSGDESGALASYDNPRTTAVMVERLEPEGSAASGRRGGLLVIGDEHFLTGQNLEPDKSPPVMENVNFVKWLVAHVRSLEKTETPP